MRSDHTAMGRGPGGAQSWTHGREKSSSCHLASGGVAPTAIGGSGGPPSNSAALLHPHSALSPGASDSDHTDVRASPDGARGAGSGKSVAAAMQAQGEFVSLNSLSFSL